MLIVHVNGPEGRGLPRPLLEKALRFVFHDEGVADGEISVTFVDDGAIRELNRRYLGRDRVTDVIAFALPDPAGAGPRDTDGGPGGRAPSGETGESASTATPLLCDVYIGIEQAERQAASLGLARDEELVRLAIHGALHVLGHDHPEGEGREESPLFRKQERAVRAVMGAR